MMHTALNVIISWMSEKSLTASSVRNVAQDLTGHRGTEQMMNKKAPEKNRGRRLGEFCKESVL